MGCLWSSFKKQKENNPKQKEKNPKQKYYEPSQEQLVEAELIESKQKQNTGLHLVAQKHIQCIFCLKLSAKRIHCGHGYHPKCLITQNLESTHQLLNKIKCLECGSIINKDEIIILFKSEDKFLMKLAELTKRQEKPQTPPVIKEDPKFLCEICQCTYLIEEGITLNCNHRYCFNCLRAYLSHKILEAQIRNLTCPQCTEEVTPNEIQYVVLEKTYKKYLNFALKGHIAQEEGVDFKACFYCESPMYVPVGTQEINCEVCHNTYCAKCNHKHPNMTCEEYENTLKPELELNYIKCLTCGEAISKDDGCNFLKCLWPNCNGITYICFLCNKKLTFKQHFSHYTRTGPFGNSCNTLDDLPDEYQ